MLLKVWNLEVLVSAFCLQKNATHSKYAPVFAGSRAREGLGFGGGMEPGLKPRAENFLLPRCLLLVKFLQPFLKGELFCRPPS